jgi:hypothetical protein
MHHHLVLPLSLDLDAPASATLIWCTGKIWVASIGFGLDQEMPFDLKYTRII